MSGLSIQDLIHKRVDEIELQSILEKEDINTRVINGNLTFIGFSDESWLDLLIKYGLDINYKTESGENALWYTNHTTSKILIKRGIDVNNLDNAGRNALFYSYHDTKKYELLIHSGININAIDKFGENVLFKCPFDQFSLLLNNGADPLVINNKGENLLFNFDINILKKLEENHIFLDYNLVNKEGLSVMKNSLLNYNPDKIKFIKSRVKDEDSLLYFMTYIQESKNNGNMISNFNDVFPVLFEKEDLSLKNKDNKSLLDLITEMVANKDYRLSINREDLNTHPLLENKENLFKSEDDDFFEDFMNNISLKDIIKMKMLVEKIIIEKNINIESSQDIKQKKRI